MLAPKVVMMELDLVSSIYWSLNPKGADRCVVLQAWGRVQGSNLYSAFTNQVAFPICSRTSLGTTVQTLSGGHS